MYPLLNEEAAEAARARARSTPGADPGIALPRWYLRRWHFHPHGYFTPGGARWYDALIGRAYHQGREQRLAETLAGLIEGFAGPAARVLDAGCGGGRPLAELARRMPAASIIGTDLAPELLRLARRRIAGLPNVEVRHADLTCLPFSAGEFDVAVASHVLGHVPRTVSRAILGELARILAPGGLLFAAEHRWHPPPPAVGGFVRAGERTSPFVRIRCFRRLAEAGAP